MSRLDLNALKLRTLYERSGPVAAGAEFARLWQSASLKDCLEDVVQFVYEKNITNKMEIGEFAYTSVLARASAENSKPYGIPFLEQMFDFYAEYSKGEIIGDNCKDARGLWEQLQLAFGELSQLDRAKLFHKLAHEHGNNWVVRVLSEEIPMSKATDIWQFITFILQEDGNDLGDGVLYIDGAWQEMAQLALEEAEDEDPEVAKVPAAA